MSSLFSESRVSFSEAARLENVHVASVHRWKLRGVHGVKLESFVFGGRRYTTLEAIERFKRRTTQAVDGLPLDATSPTSTRRKSAIEAAERELEKAGI